MIKVWTKIKCSDCDGEGTFEGPTPADVINCDKCEGDGVLECWMDLYDLIDAYNEGKKGVKDE